MIDPVVFAASHFPHIVPVSREAVSYVTLSVIFYNAAEGQEFDLHVHATAYEDGREPQFRITENRLDSRGEYELPSPFIAACVVACITACETRKQHDPQVARFLALLENQDD